MFDLYINIENYNILASQSWEIDFLKLFFYKLKLCAKSICFCYNLRLEPLHTTSVFMFCSKTMDVKRLIIIYEEIKPPFIFLIFRF